MAGHTRMLLGFLIGALAGLLVYSLTGGSAPWLTVVTEWVTAPIGAIFLRLLFMLVIPLVFSALVMGIAEMGDVRSLGRLGIKMGVFTVVFTGIAVVIGLVLMNVFRPGAGLDREMAAHLMEASGQRLGDILAGGQDATTGMAMLLEIIPVNVFASAAANDVLAVMFFALFFGIGLVITNTPATGRVLEVMQGVLDTSMTLINVVIGMAPLAIACLVFNLTAVFGWGLILRLGGFVGITLSAMALQFFVVYGLGLWLVARRNPWTFLRNAREALLMAFSTSSSSATLPTTLKVAEGSLNLPPRVSRFVLTIGATANQHGTALFEGVTVLFLAQFFHVDLTIADQLMIMLICILGGVGTAGVPAGSLPVIAMICVKFTIPPEGIGIILGVDRFLDMCRTTLNVGGDLVAVAVIGDDDGVPDVA